VADAGRIGAENTKVMKDHTSNVEVSREDRVGQSAFVFLRFKS
jgi:hypothetical protein